MKEIKIKVKGMVCSGCEKRVKNALENINGVDEVIADHNKDLVNVKLSSNITENDLKEKIEDIGFEFIEIVK